MTSTNATIIGVHSADSIIVNNGAPAEIRVETETLDYMREPPPPYSVSGAIELHPPPVVVHQTVVEQQPLKYRPIIYTCGECGETILTKVHHVNTRKTHMCAGFICGCTLWCMLCCLGAIPYILPICKRAKHFCPNCDSYIGDYSKV